MTASAEQGRRIGPAALGQRMRRVASSLAVAREGVTTIMIACAGSAIAVAGLLAVDLARIDLATTRQQGATDASALAAGNNITSTSLNADARQVFDANFPPSYLGTSLESFTLTTTTAAGGVQRLTVRVVATLPSVIARLGAALGVSPRTFETTAIVQRSTRGAEIALVLDNTGSMYNSTLATTNNITALRSSAQLLVDVIFNGQRSVPNLYVSLVPYVATVNIGRHNAAWLADPATTPRRPSSLSEYAPTTWGGCVFARPSPYDQSDDPPTVALYDPFFWPSKKEGGYATKAQLPAAETLVTTNNWPIAGKVEERAWSARPGTTDNEAWGPNTGCPITSPILPLTGSYDDLTRAISGITGWNRGGTMANVGLVWGWATLSPRWRGLWRFADGAPIAPDRPLDYNQRFNSKIVVLMTDGNNSWYQQDWTAYGANNGTTTTAVIDNRMLAACSALKTRGIVVFAITLGATVSAATKQLYTSCASATNQDPLFPGQKYFHAPTGDVLRGVFTDVAGQLTELRLTQ